VNNSYQKGQQMVNWVNWQGVGGGHSLVVILVNFGLKKRVEEVKVLKRREMNEKGWDYIQVQFQN
jgi:hypothetical protein